MVFLKAAAETTQPAPGSFQEYQGTNEKVIHIIRDSTKYLHSKHDKEKLKSRIERTDQKITDHKEYLKARAGIVKNSMAEFGEAANRFNELRKAYELKRDVMANDDNLVAIIEDGGKKRGFLVQSVKKMVQGKTSKKTWNAHEDHYKSDPKNMYGDAMDTVEKGSKDLTTIEQILHAVKNDSKLLTPVIQEYNDLVITVNAVVDQTLAIIAKRQEEWKKYEAAVDAELVDKKELKANPTQLYAAILSYKEIRAKVGPQVGAKKKGVCAVM